MNEDIKALYCFIDSNEYDFIFKFLRKLPELKDRRLSEVRLGAFEIRNKRLYFQFMYFSLDLMWYQDVEISLDTLFTWKEEVLNKQYKSISRRNRSDFPEWLEKVHNKKQELIVIH